MNKRIGLVAVVVLLIVTGVVINNKIKENSDAMSSAKSKGDPYLVILDADRDILKHYERLKEKDAASIYQAMIRLGEVKDPLAREVALKLATDPTTYFREGSAQALGYFEDDEALNAIEKLMQDKVPSVVRYAILSLGLVQSPKRRELLAKVGTSMQLSGSEQVEWIASRFRTGATPEDKERALSELSHLANQEDETATTAGLKMVEMAPDQPLTVEILKRKIEGGKDIKVMGIGIRVLASQRNPWIEGRMVALSENANPLVRKAVVQSLHRNCFKERWQILDAIMKHETDESVIDVALEEPLLFPESHAHDFYALAAKNPKLNPKQLALTSELPAQIDKSPGLNPCAEKAQ